MESAIPEITPENTEADGLQPPFSLFLEDSISEIKEELSELIEENNTGIEKKVKKAIVDDTKKEQEEYVKNVTYEAENSYAQKNPYAPKKDYERIEQIKPKQEEEEKSFLWR